MRKIGKTNRNNLVPVVGHGAVAMEALTGNQKVPVLNLDLSTRPDIRDFLAIHKSTPPGDVVSRWCAPRWGKTHLILMLEFVRPVRLTMGLPLYLYIHAGVIEGIDQAHTLFIKEGDSEETKERMKETLNTGIYIEIGATDFPVDWKSWYFKLLIKKFRSENLSRKEAKDAAKSIMVDQFSFWRERVYYQADTL